VVKLSEHLAVDLRHESVSVFSFRPQLLPIGLSEAVLAAKVNPDSPEGRVAAWAPPPVRRGGTSDVPLA